MIGRRAQGLVAVTVALAGMAVLLAAGGAPAPVAQVLQPTDPGEFVPSSLSHHAFALWARADVDAEQAAELRIFAHGCLQVPVCPRRGDREHLAGEIARPPLLELPGLLEELAVLLELLP